MTPEVLRVAGPVTSAALDLDTGRGALLDQDLRVTGRGCWTGRAIEPRSVSYLAVRVALAVAAEVATREGEAERAVG